MTCSFRELHMFSASKMWTILWNILFKFYTWTKVFEQSIILNFFFGLVCSIHTTYLVKKTLYEDVSK